MSIKYDGVDLTVDPYSISDTDHDSAPQAKLNTMELSRMRGSVVVNDFYQTKTIKINGKIKGTSQADFEQKMDVMKELIARQDKNLDIDYAGGTRRYVCKVVDHNLPRKFYNISFAPFDITFLVEDGVGIDITNTTINQVAGRTVTPYTSTFNIVGSAAPKDAQVKLTFTAASAITAVALTIGTNRITLTNAINAADVVIFDLENKVVTVNGVQKDYTGFVPDMSVGSNNFTVAVTGTSFTYNMDVIHKKTYL